TLTHPAELSKQLFQKGYEVNKMFSYRPGKEKEFLNDVYKMTGQLTELCLDLMKTEAWDFFMVVFRDTDELSHYFWKFMDAKHPLHVPGQTEYQDAILSYYQFVDSEMAKLLDRVGDDVTVVVLSDHGEGPLYRDVLLNEWLKQKGYLEVKLSGDTQKRGRQYLAKIGITRANISVALRKLKLSKVETWIKDKLGDRINILPKNSRAEFPEAIDWSKTQAFSFGYHGQIYINRNLLPKDENGEPLKSAYEALVKKIIQDLYQLRDPADGKPVVDHAFQKDEIYAGPYTNWAPDITVVMRNFSYITRLGYEFSSKSGEIFAPPSTFESGSHRQEGLLIISGSEAENHQGYFEEANLADVMPTILYLLGCPVPQKLDGKTLKNW
ncbi:MAG: alkaline phosphatase family protein, partial [Chitinophagaceae bacterium]|nr:alkaline phosphatase family protein [Chitinophagaceae bacterium]